MKGQKYNTIPYNNSFGNNNDYYLRMYVGCKDSNVGVQKQQQVAHREIVIPPVMSMITTLQQKWNMKRKQNKNRPCKLHSCPKLPVHQTFIARYKGGAWKRDYCPTFK